MCCSLKHEECVSKIMYKKYISWYYIFLTIVAIIYITDFVFPIKYHLQEFIIYKVFFYNDRYVPSMQILSFVYLIYTYLIDINNTYMFFSSGDIYVYSDRIECVPQIKLFKNKVIYFSNSVAVICGTREYIKGVSTIVVDSLCNNDSIANKLFRDKIFFGVNSMCISSDIEIVKSYNIIIENIKVIKKRGVNE